MSQDILAAAHSSLTSLVNEYLEALDGVPDDDLATWKPTAAENGGGEMNTLSGVSVHTALAGTWMIVHQVFGLDVPRDRDSEFTRVATREEIDGLFANMLQQLADLTASNADVDLSSPATTKRPARPNATKAEMLIHAVDHTAQHLGHVQIHKQIWLAERGSK